MTANSFGGFWTQTKLDVLREYLGFYASAMSKQAWCKLVYIDAFAGTGRCLIKTADGGERIIDGSAKIALDCSPAFDAYRFIESNKVHQAELQQLIDNHPNGHKAKIAPHSAADMLPSILIGYNWQKHRGVLFLDPFGLQCDYSLLKQIANTKALDVFFLVSLSGLYRQAAIDERDISPDKAAILTNVFGSDKWKTEMYKPSPQEDLFDAPAVTRDRGWAQILQFMTRSLSELFPYVGPPNLMYSPQGAPLFALYFAVSNDSEAALRLAKKVSKEILSKLNA